MSWVSPFFVGCMWLFLPIAYFTMRNNAICKKNLILSVTLPPEGQQDPEVIAYVSEFRKKWLWMFLLTTAAILPALFFRQFSFCALWSMVWLPAAMAVVFWVYGKGHLGLKAIKRRRGWQAGAAAPAAAELAPLKLPKPLRTGWFLPPMLLSVLPVISVLADELDPAWKVLLTFNAFLCLVLTACSLLFYGLIFRQKPDMIDENTDRTAALTRVRRYNWTKTWLLVAWLTGLFSVAVWIAQGRGFLAITLVYSAAIVVVTLATEFAVRRAQHRLGGEAVPAVDEDDFWIWGQFYYNPYDKKAFVNERVGMGMSMNFATVGGKIMAVFTVLVLLAMIPLGIWLVAEETTDVVLTCTDTTVTVSQIGTVYEVELADVVHAELLEEMPVTYKIAGTGMEHLLKGSFAVEGYGSAKLCLDPHDPPFLLLETADSTYIFGGAEAERIYDRLREE